MLEKYKIHPTIKHLTPDEIEELYHKYLDPNNKVADLIKAYALNITLNQFFKLFPPIELKDQLCPYCHIAMYRKRKRKAQYYPDEVNAECYQCHHKIFSDKYSYDICECTNCIEIARSKEREELKRKRELIKTKYSPNHITPIHYHDLSFSQKLTLLTLFKVRTDEQLNCLYSLADFDNSFPKKKLSPTDKMDIECMNELYNNKIIIADPASPIEAFVEYSNYTEIDIKKLNTLPNITFDGLKRAELKHVYQKIEEEFSKGIQPQWEDDIRKLLYKLATEEAVQYIHVKAAESKSIQFIAEKKTRQIIEQLLEKFSVSNLYYFIKKATDDAIVFYDKGKATSKKHAGNIIPQRIDYWSEKLINEGWECYKYNRDSHAPRSEISKVFFDSLLKDEDAGFHKAPGTQWKELFPTYFSSISQIGDQKALIGMSGQLLSSDFVLSAGALIFNQPLNKICLVQNQKGEYCLPKGRKNVGESVAQAALREVYEETGFHCKLLPATIPSRATPATNSKKHIPDTVRTFKGATEPIAISMRPGPDNNQKIIFWFLAVADGTYDQDTQMENENFRVHFYTFEEALERVTFATDKQLVQAAIEIVKLSRK